MKKILICIILLAIICTSTSCSLNMPSSTSYNLYFENNIRWMNNRLSAIKEFINNGDKESFKTLFSPNVRDNVPDLDSDIEELFEFIEGNITTIEEPRGPHESKRSDHGKVNKYLTYWTVIKTEEKDYRISIKETVFDNVDRGNEGLVDIVIMDNNEDHTKFKFNSDEAMGIYIFPEDAE